MWACARTAKAAAVCVRESGGKGWGRRVQGKFTVTECDGHMSHGRAGGGGENRIWVEIWKKKRCGRRTVRCTVHSANSARARGACDVLRFLLKNDMG